MRAFTTSFAFPGAEDLLHTNTTDSLLFHRRPRSYVLLFNAPIHSPLIYVLHTTE